MESAEDSYEETVGILLDLKTSIARSAKDELNKYEIFHVVSHAVYLQSRPLRMRNNPLCSNLSAQR